MNSLKNQRHEAFCHHYVQTGCASQAYIEAGYTAHRGSAARLLKREDVASRIQSLRKHICDDLHITSKRVLAEYAKIAFANLSDFIVWDEGRVVPKPLSQLSDGAFAAMSELKETETTRGRTISFKLYDKMNALNVLSKHVGLFEGFAADDQSAKAGPSLNAFVHALHQGDQYS